MVRVEMAVLLTVEDLQRLADALSVCAEAEGVNEAQPLTEAPALLEAWALAIELGVALSQAEEPVVGENETVAVSDMMERV